MDYQKLLEYYLSSDEWEYELASFFDDFRHYYVPNEEVFAMKNGEPVKSDVYQQYEQKLTAAGGCFYDVHLTQSQFQKYFDVRYSPNQRFAVLFALWWGLTDEQIRRIANLKQKKFCLSWLDYFLRTSNSNGSDFAAVLGRGKT